MSEFPKVFDNFLSCTTFAFPTNSALLYCLALARKESCSTTLMPDANWGLEWTRSTSIANEDSSGKSTKERRDIPNILMPIGDLGSSMVFAFVSPASSIAASFKWRLPAEKAGVRTQAVVLDAEAYIRATMGSDALQRWTQIPPNMQGIKAGVPAQAAGRQVIAFEDFGMMLGGLEIDSAAVAACTRSAFETFRPYLKLAS
jgi:hypothetical protein